MLAPGRTHDWAMLEARYKNAKNARERELVKAKMDFLVRESRNKDVRQLRQKLIQAAQVGDTRAGDHISEDIYRITNKQRQD